MPTPAQFVRVTALSTVGHLGNLPSNLVSVFDGSLLAHAIDSIQADAELSLHQFVVGTATALTAALSAGYVLWALRGSYLATMAFSSLPAWMTCDPLPILDDADGRSITRRKQDNAVGESLVDIVSLKNSA